MSEYIVKTHYTTGDVAKICDMGITTVKKYCDEGRIKAEKSPVTGYRRIPHEALIAFMRRHGISRSRIPGYHERVLVVDDEASVVDYVTRALSRSQGTYEVDGTTNGFDACIRLRSFRPDVIVLDIHMPEVDGKEILRAIRRDEVTKDVKVLVITGFPDELEEMHRLGADDHLVKPLSGKELRARVAQLLKDDYS